MHHGFDRDLQKLGQLIAIFRKQDEKFRWAVDKNRELSFSGPACANKHKLLTARPSSSVTVHKIYI